VAHFSASVLAQFSNGVDKKGHSRLSATIKHPCSTCNSGWMSQLEEVAAPILTPMMEGRSLLLTVDSARILQTWATKTALNFAFSYESDYSYPIPRRLSKDLYSSRNNYAPVPDAIAWVAKYDPLGQFAYQHMTAQGSGYHPTTRHFQSVIRVVFVAGHAAFYVRLPDSADGQGLGWRDPLPEYTLLSDVDPSSPVQWQHGSIDDTGISDTFNLHINADIYPGQDLGWWTGLP
jgi:hypothetical protein